LNATVRDQEIAEYQLKSPFNLLQMDSNGALISEKWALPDLTKRPDVLFSPRSPTLTNRRTHHDDVIALVSPCNASDGSRHLQLAHGEDLSGDVTARER
jgi:hypothetical protein